MNSLNAYLERPVVQMLQLNSVKTMFEAIHQVDLQAKVDLAGQTAMSSCPETTKEHTFKQGITWSVIRQN